MISAKRLSLLVLILATLLTAMILTIYSSSTTSASSKPLRGKVLRAKHKLHVRPNPEELKALRQGEPTDHERRLENKIPKHLPLKIKVKENKVDKFKDLNNERWARELELEVTNTGDKPIYFLELMLTLPEIKGETGYNLSFIAYYGRDELGNFEIKAEPSDVPIRPGETFVLKIDVRNVAGYEAANRKFGWQLPKRVELKFQMLSFGDGTGFLGSHGAAIPRSSGTLPSGARQQNRGDPCSGNSASSIPSNATFSPAMFFPVNFLFLGIPMSGFLDDTQPCCAPDDCFQAKANFERVCLNCAPQRRITATFCSDLSATCLSPTFRERICLLDNGEPFSCQVIDVTACGESAPSPSPTPSPSPSPTPTPTPCPLIDPSACASGEARDYCTNPNPPEAPNDLGGCPLYYYPDGLCCTRLPCPSPTPTPAQCESGNPIFFDYPECRWICFNPLPTPTPDPSQDPIFIYYCTPYVWVTYVSYDGGKTWTPTGEIEYAGCF